jgi:hypothetical protein
MNFVGGEGVGKPSPKTTFREQTTSKGLKEKINQYLKFSGGFEWWHCLQCHKQKLNHKIFDATTLLNP